ncbi:MAG: hypothetical protein R2851_07285 [Caldilineaceae bacterium]
MPKFLAGLIFPPFSLFDFAARVLPGPLITGTIDVLVRIIHGLNLGATSSTAKLVEQGMALVKFTVLGGLWGMLLGACTGRGGRGRSLAFAGLGTGTLLALGFTGIEAYLGFPVFGPFASFLWLELIFGVWGYALGWMLRAPAETPATANRTGAGRQAQSNGGGPTGDDGARRSTWARPVSSRSSRQPWAWASSTGSGGALRPRHRPSRRRPCRRLTPPSPRTLTRLRRLRSKTASSLRPAPAGDDANGPRSTASTSTHDRRRWTPLPRGFKSTGWWSVAQAPLHWTTCAPDRPRSLKPDARVHLQSHRRRPHRHHRVDRDSAQGLSG